MKLRGGARADLDASEGTRVIEPNQEVPVKRSLYDSGLVPEQTHEWVDPTAGLSPQSRRFLGAFPGSRPLLEYLRSRWDKPGLADRC